MGAPSRTSAAAHAGAGGRAAQRLGILVMMLMPCSIRPFLISLIAFLVREWRARKMIVSPSVKATLRISSRAIFAARRLALAAGEDGDDFVARDIAELVLGDEGLQSFHEADIAPHPSRLHGARAAAPRGRRLRLPARWSGCGRHSRRRW